MSLKTYLLLAVLTCTAFSVCAQENAVDLLMRNRYPVKVENGKLSGKGVDFILRETKGVQFVGIGEQHNNREIPCFTSALFAALKEKHGFSYLALEQDPITSRLVSSPEFIGDKEKIFGFAKRNPNAFTFVTDQELGMIAEAGRISTARSNRIWGLDQVFGAIHGLNLLSPMLATDGERTAVREIIGRLKVLEEKTTSKGERFTIADATGVEGFVELLEKLRGQKDVRAEFIVSQMLISARVYAGNIAAGKGKLTGLGSNVAREENMKYLLMSEYRNAQAKGDRLPKVLLKFGHYHTIRGRSWSNVHTLGNFVSEFAKSNGMESFMIAIYINNAEGDYSVLSSYPDYKPFADASPADSWSLFDLRPLRSYIHAGKLEGGNSELTRIAFGFDAALIIGGGRRGTYDLFSQ